MDQEQSRVKADIRKLSSEVAELTENMNANQNNIFRSSEMMEQIGKQMNWNQQQLSEWLDKTKVVLALEKYSGADEAKIKELSLPMERLMADQVKVRKQLDAEMAETHADQIALEKVCSSSALFIASLCFYVPFMAPLMLHHLRACFITTLRSKILSHPSLGC